METRREFLAHSGSLLAGMATLPNVADALAVGESPVRSNELLTTSALTQERSMMMLQLRCFERDFVPSILKTCKWSEQGIIPWPSMEALFAKCYGSERDWKTATHWLAEAACADGNGAWKTPFPSPELTSLLQSISHGCYQDLFDPPSRPCFVVDQGKIHWRIFSNFLVPEDRAEYVLSQVGHKMEKGADPWEELRRQLPRIKQWYGNLVPWSAEKMNGWYRLLPTLADLDPAFAIETFDLGKMEEHILTSEDLSAEEKIQQKKVIHGDFFALCLCTGMAYVLEALMNNQFHWIPNLLHYPQVYRDPFWRHFMVASMFAVLYHKVAVLRDLIDGKPLECKRGVG